MENVQTPERWVLIRVVGARVAESFKLLAGWSTPNQKKELWTFTTAITSARRSENGVILSTASEHFDVSTQRDSYAFNVKTAEIKNKYARITFIPTGETYENQAGEKKEKTALVT